MGGGSAGRPATGDGGTDVPSPLRILGIDPGTRVVGWGLVEVATTRAAPRPSSVDRAGAQIPVARRVANLRSVGRPGVGAPRLVGADAVHLRGKDAAARLGALADTIDALIESHGPHELALEEAFFGKSVQSALRIGEARGVVLACAHRAGVAVHQFPPARIKRCVTGSGAAAKEQVAQFVSRALGLSIPLPGGDAADAVAVALTRFEARRAPRLEAARPSAARGSRV